MDIRKLFIAPYYFGAFENLLLKTYISDDDLEDFLEKILLNSDDIKNRKLITSELEKCLTNNFRGKLFSFGSTVNGLGTRNCDLDFHFRIFDKETNQILKFDKKQAKIELATFRQLLRRHFKQNFLICFIRANCPIIKLSARGSEKYIPCDLNISNPFGIYNSIFIKQLCEFCPRFQQLTTILRFWAKTNGIIHSNGMNSYTFTILVIYFFQTLNIFKPVAELNIDFEEHFFSTDPDEFETLVKGNCQQIVSNKAESCNVFQLIGRFFKFYSDFEFYNKIISIRLGKAFRKDEFETKIRKNLNFEVSAYLCVEDPFELEKNIAKNVSSYKLCEFVWFCHSNSLLNENDLRIGRNFSNLLNLHSKSTIYQSNCKIFPCICWLKKFFEIYESKEQNEHFSKSFIIFYAKTLMKNLIQNKTFKFGNYNFHLIDYNEAIISPNNMEDKILFGDFKFQVALKKRKERYYRRYLKKNKNEISQTGQQSNLVKGESTKINNQQQNRKMKKQKTNFSTNNSEMLINLNKPGPSGIKVIETSKVNKTNLKGKKINDFSSKAVLDSQDNKKPNFIANQLKKINSVDQTKPKSKMQSTSKNDNKQVSLQSHAGTPLNDNVKNNSKKSTQNVELKTSINKEKSKKSENKEQRSLSGETKEEKNRIKNNHNNNKENLKMKETAKVSGSTSMVNIKNQVTGSSIKLEGNDSKNKIIEKESVENRNGTQVTKEFQISLIGVMKAVNYPFLDLINDKNKDCGELYKNVFTSLSNYMKYSTCFCKKNRKQAHETNENVDSK